VIVGKIFTGGAARGFFQNFAGRRPKVVKFVFSHPKLRKQTFLLKIFKSRGDQGPLAPLPTSKAVFEYTMF